MKKATHNGTCQRCGRRQAVTPNGMAKHGYTTKLGFFNGTCAGSDRNPIEVSTELLDDTVDFLTRKAGEGLATISLQKITVTWNRKESGRGVWTLTTRDFSSPAELAEWKATDEGRTSSFHYYTWEELERMQLGRMHSQARAMQAHAAELTMLKADRSGQPLYERVAR